MLHYIENKPKAIEVETKNNITRLHLEVENIKEIQKELKGKLDKILAYVSEWAILQRLF